MQLSVDDVSTCRRLTVRLRVYAIVRLRRRQAGSGVTITAGLRPARTVFSGAEPATFKRQKRQPFLNENDCRLVGMIILISNLELEFG